MKQTQYILPIFIALFTFCGVVRADEPTGLAQCMSERTPLFIQVDVKKLVKAYNEVLEVALPEESEALKKDVLETISKVKKLAKSKEFNPALLNYLDQIRVYFVMQILDKPVTTTHNYQTPKWDSESGDFIKGEFEEHTTTRTEFLARALIVETPNEEIAGEFIEVLKSFLEKKQEESSEDNSLKYENVDAEGGVIIKMRSDRNYAGSKGKYLYFTDFHSEKLWNQIAQQREDNITTCELYRHYQQQPGTSLATAIVDVRTIVNEVEKHMKLEIEENNNESLKSDLANFQKISALFSLKKMKKLGANVSLSIQDKKLISTGDIKLTFEEGISPLLKAILNGGAALSPPKFVSNEIPALMVRLGLGDILDHSLKSLDPQTAMMVNMIKGQVEMQTGITIEELIKSFSGELYLFFDTVEKKYFDFDWSGEDGGMKRIEKFGPQPELTFFLAVKDEIKFDETLTQLFTNLAAKPGMSSSFKKQIYQETVTYAFGPQVGTKGVGDNTVTLALIDRYLTIGQWKQVTALIRKSRNIDKSQQTALSKLAESNKNSNFIGVVPPEFNKKLNKMNETQFKDLEVMITRMQKQLTNAEMGDDELEKEIQKSFVKILKTVMRVAKKSQDSISTKATFTGELKENMYHMKIDNSATVK